MTPSIELLHLIDSLPDDDRQHIDEYIHFLSHQRNAPTDPSTYDSSYVEYIKAGIREGEEALAKNDVLSGSDALNYLDELLAK